MELLAKKMLFKVLDLQMFYETDEIELKETISILTKELESLDKNSIIYNYLIESLSEQTVNEDIWNRFFKE